MEKSSWAVNTFLSVAESFDHTDTDYTTRILEIGCGEADTDVAAQLQVAPRTQIVYMHRLRLIKDEPVHLSTSFLPLAIASPLLEIDLNNTSLYKVMDEILNLKITRVDRRVFARLADIWEAEHLKLPEVSAIMVLKGTAFTVIEKPVEYSIARFPTDRSQFIIQSRTLV
jgi:GntR family transcriptional regulator